MTGKTRSSFLSLLITAVLLFSALSPSIAHADEGTPTPETPPAETDCTPGNNSGECPVVEGATEVPDNSGETSTPDQPTVEPVSTATEVPVEATSTPAEMPATEEPTVPPTEEADPVAEEESSAPESSILDDIPDDTTITVLDSDGQVQPLATQETADAIEELDPIWCPAGQAPTPGANGCTPSFDSFKKLLSFLAGNTNYQGAGTIYIQEGVYISGGANDFNDYDLSNISNSDLTVTGGWNPTTGTVDSGSTSQFRIPLRIGSSTNPWGGSITISNLTIDKSDGTSLVLYTNENILLTNVNITNAHNNGAGAELNAGGNIDIYNSNFIRNKKAGAIVRATGNVSVSSSSFSNPTTGRQQITGIDIVSGGSVTLADVAVNGNREVGANINAGGVVAIANSFFSGTKAMKGSGPSRTFWGYGLQVTTPENIVMASVTANDNFLWGASLKTDQNVLIADSFFNANTTADPHFIDDTGLLITSGGNVTINNTQANDNRLIGASIEAAGDVVVEDSSFSNNRGVTFSTNGTPVFQGYGLKVVTQGDILLTAVNASNNTLFGAYLDAGGKVDVSHSNFDNHTSGSATNQLGRGLEVISSGMVNLWNVSVVNNQTFGANIQAGDLVILQTVTATDNGLNGLDVDANCKTVYVIDGNYSNNGAYGLNVTNAALDQTGTPVFDGNGAGGLFEDPGTCVFPPVVPPANNNGGTPNTPVVNGPVPGQAASQQVAGILNNGQTNVFTNNSSLTRASTVKGVFAGVTLNDFLTLTRTSAGNVYIGTFAGIYAYIHSNSGMQIIAFLPASNSLVMDGQ